MELQIKTLTPIWTGGVETGKMDRLHETSIIGSLRWWYEAIVRGLGGDVCDPTSDNPEDRCQFDAKAYEKTKNTEDGLASVCSVCRLFGCTGWKRRFEVQAVTTDLQAFWLATKDKPNKFNHWWLSEVYESQESYVALGQIILRFRWIRGYESQHKLIQALLSLVSQLGGLGAKTQYGFGLFLYADVQFISQSLAIIKQNLVNPNPRKDVSGIYPTLSDYWLLQCVIPNNDVTRQFNQVNIVGSQQTFDKYKSHLLPVSFDIRYKLPGSNDKGLRQAYRLRYGKMSTRQLFGTLKGSEKDKRSSSVFVSHLYKENDSSDDYQLRVWGFTNPDITGEIEKSLKNIFPNLCCPQTKGSDLLAGVEVQI
ncbi:MAG: hypothetical protein GFH27_549301n328 [Chloroflexi bacterium AL-W]|nr:hypothetical protein [Chloroflexi bacterium AL-N1]NOK68522.1 hypothetical protein [Chloroflexi bacterium AL-N10]NOK74168.1 hypothetical protein [Chloroflexi bacterium AL-N5]NOK83135.1 hypothetical protein [Chloroflexi bacterium AL-W]NOK90658.1 hypothetical protein [Chloroflexi bacterium AL-N15]